MTKTTPPPTAMELDPWVKAADVNVDDLIFRSAWSSPLHVTSVSAPTHPGVEAQGYVVIRGWRWLNAEGHWSPRETVMTCGPADPWGGMFRTWNDAQTRSLYPYPVGV